MTSVSGWKVQLPSAAETQADFARLAIYSILSCKIKITVFIFLPFADQLSGKKMSANKAVKTDCGLRIIKLHKIDCS